jgi:hypothetical protein
LRPPLHRGGTSFRLQADCHWIVIHARVCYRGDVASRRRRPLPRRVARASKTRASKRAAKKKVVRAAKPRPRPLKPAARPTAPPPVPSPPAPPPPSPAETLLLALASDVSARAGDGASGSDVAAMVDMVSAAYAPGAPLAEALREPAAEKTAQLARGWAREQMRLALMEIVTSASAAQMMRTDTDADTLAWLWLAACESLAHETPSAVADRVSALTTFLTARDR